MTCCMTAPNHYLNQYWFIINEARWWHLPESSFTETMIHITHYNVSKITFLKILLHLPRSDELSGERALPVGWHSYSVCFLYTSWQTWRKSIQNCWQNVQSDGLHDTMTQFRVRGKGQTHSILRRRIFYGLCVKFICLYVFRILECVSLKDRETDD